MSATVLLAADDAIRGPLHQALEQAGLDVHAEAAVPAAVIESAQRRAPDVCVLDLNAGGDAIAVTEALVSCVPGVKVAILAESADERLFLDCMRAGALGYLPHDVGGQALVAAVSDVLAGHPAVPGRLLTLLVEELRPQI